MEPKLVIPTDSVEPFIDLRSRLLRIISIVMLLFSVVQLLAVGTWVYGLLRLSTSPGSSFIATIRDSGEAFTISRVLFAGLADIFMAWGAVHLYTRRPASLLIFGLWLWLLVWSSSVLRNFFEN